MTHSRSCAAGLIHDLNNVFQTLMDAADSLSDDPRWASVSAAIFRSIERARKLPKACRRSISRRRPLKRAL